MRFKICWEIIAVKHHEMCKISFSSSGGEEKGEKKISLTGGKDEFRKAKCLLEAPKGQAQVGSPEKANKAVGELAQIHKPGKLTKSKTTRGKHWGKKCHKAQGNKENRRGRKCYDC